MKVAIAVLVTIILIQMGTIYQRDQTIARYSEFICEVPDRIELAWLNGWGHSTLYCLGEICPVAEPDSSMLLAIYKIRDSAFVVWERGDSLCQILYVDEE